MNLVDSCGWLEYFANGSNANFFSPVIENIDYLLVPSICLLEVFKRIVQQRTEDEALQAMVGMQQAKVVVMDATLALEAAKLGLRLKMPLADSVILATAYMYNATVWTQDADFKGIKGVKYCEKPKLKKKDKYHLNK